MNNNIGIQYVDYGNDSNEAPLNLGPQSNCKSNSQSVNDDTDTPLSHSSSSKANDSKLPKGVQEVIYLEPRSFNSNGRKNALNSDDADDEKFQFHQPPRHQHRRSLTPTDPSLFQPYKMRELAVSKTDSNMQNNRKATKPTPLRKRKKQHRSQSNVLDGTRKRGLYHEKQEWEMCLKHALNALFQCKKFTNTNMDNICKILAPDKMINPHKSIFQTGNYDANVLMMALHQENVDVQWFDSRKAASELSLNDDFLCPEDKYVEFLGFIVNNPQKRMIVFNRRHWLTIKRIKGIWYDLDSKNSAPKRYEEKQLLDWLVKACRNGAQIMICRRKREPEESKEDTQDSTVFSGVLESSDNKAVSKKKQYRQKQYESPLFTNAIPLQTPSQTDLEDSETSKTITDSYTNGNGHIKSRSNGNFLDASDGFKMENNTNKVAGTAEKPPFTQHLSYPM